MKTVVLGGGALGSVIAAHLCNSGNDVTIVAREPRASLLQRDGVRITGLIEMVARVPIETDVSAVREADLVINALKTHQSAAALAALRLKGPALAFSVQNGVYKNRELAGIFGREQVLGASAMIAAEVLPDGATRFTLNDGLPIGELGGGETPRVVEVVGMLRRSGISAVVSNDIEGVEWTKYAFFVPTFCLALITRQETHRFLSHAQGARVVAALAREMAQLAQAEGVQLAEGGGLSAAQLSRVDFEEAVRTVQAFGARFAQIAPKHKISGLQDLERGRPTEIEETVGYALRRSKELGLSLPVLSTCYSLCSAISPVSPPAVAAAREPSRG